MKKGMSVANRYAVAAAVMAAGVCGLAGRSMAASSYSLTVQDSLTGSGKMIAGTSNVVTATIQRGPTGSGVDFSNFQLLVNGAQPSTGVSGSSTGTNVTTATKTYDASNLAASTSAYSLTASVTTTATFLSPATFDSLQVYDHANAQFATGTFSSYTNGPGSSSYTPVAPTQTLSNANHALAVNFGTIWATPANNPYPVYAYFDVTNPLATAVSVSLSGLTGGAAVTPAGTRPTWTLQSSTGGTFAPGTLTAGGVYHARVLFNTNNPSLYLPGSPFSAAWDISMLEDQSIAGHATTAQVLHLTASAVAVPLPASAAMGTGALGLLGAIKTLRARRMRAK